ncbi:MAG: hypothetical protein IJZ29_02975 [Clostridia bacterium]|nr:hypothetical protein [Clostridia bacterium]
MKRELKLKQLFSAVQNRNGVALSVIFSRFAVKWNMQKNSVRNMYYLALNKIMQDEIYAKKLNVNAELLNKNDIKPFSSSEMQNLVSEIEKKVSMGQSVRNACQELANGDITLMLRYQNKYRAIKTKAKKKVKENISNCVRMVDYKNSNSKQVLSNNTNMQSKLIESTSGKEFKSTKIPDNVIQFRKKESSLTDNELQSLFMGLVRIVRNSAVADVNNALKEQYNKQAIEVRNLLKSLANTKEELNESLRENSRLKKEIELLKMDKVKSYEKFMQKITEKHKESENISKK